MIIAGCSNQEESKKQKIEVDKRIGSEDKYEEFSEVTDYEQVKKAKKIINNIAWENKIVSMVRPPDYRFAFQFKNPEKEAKVVSYELWIGPNKDRVELVVDAGDQYSQLDSNKSAELFEIITGTKLSSLK